MHIVDAPNRYVRGSSNQMEVWFEMNYDRSFIQRKVSTLLDYVAEMGGFNAGIVLTFYFFN